MTNPTGKFFIGVGGQFWVDKPKPGDAVYKLENGKFIKMEVRNNDGYAMEGDV